MSPKSSELEPLLSLPPGPYHPPTTTDTRGPCPVLNTLANHGYISRNGRNIRATEMKSAMQELGISISIRQLLTSAAYLPHQDDPPTGLWALIRHPFAYIFHTFGTRAPGQVDASGSPTLNLDELDRHNAIEHDVSMSRRDMAQGDNHTAQHDLISALLASSLDSETLTPSDLSRFRRYRIAQQQADNPALDFGSIQDLLGLSENAILQRVFGERGSDWAVPVSYMAAIFREERLPIEEGWKKRWWWPLGLIELTAATQRFRKLVGGVEAKA
ncbi:putative peroxidase [Usnea florida]